MTESISRKPNTRGNGPDEQFPVDIKVLTKVQLTSDCLNGDILRIIVTNDQTAGNYTPFREYNFGNTGLSIDGVDAFVMRCDSLETSTEAIQAFVGPMSLELDISQHAAWVRGVYAPTAERKRLYKAQDPDDSTKMIGLLIEQDLRGNFVQLTWYKTRDTGTVFHSAPEHLPFALVRDENGVASHDPNDIGGWTWYYTTSGSR